MIFRKNFQLTVLDLMEFIDKEVYASEIKTGLCNKKNRIESEPSLGAIVVTLNRLEENGLVSYVLTEGDNNRNGLPRRKYTITLRGSKSLENYLKSYKSNVLREEENGISSGLLPAI